MTLFDKIKNKIRRWINQLHSYDFPSENNGWIKYANNPVFGNSNTGTIFDPYVYIYDNELYMFASKRVSGSIICLNSQDGIAWNYHHTVHKGIKGTWQNVVNRACTIFKDNIWHIFYTGQNNGISSIGYLTQDKLYNDINIYPNPIITATEIHEGVSVMNPCVIWNEKIKLFQMWYSAGENYEPDVICYATSSDCIHWEKYPIPVLTAFQKHSWEKYKVGACHVILDSNNLYTMYYIGYQNIDVARICYATSTDGINWFRPHNNLILSPTKKTWDADAVYKPTVINFKEKTLLWYNGRKTHDEFIGLAIKKYKDEKSSSLHE